MFPHWHTIWTIHGVGLPQAANTSWASLAALYSSLGDQGLSPVRCDAIAEPVATALVPAGEIGPENAQAMRRDIIDLSSPQGDRVAGRLGLVAVLVGRTHVELLLQHPFDGLHQKLSRLKSRSATLLSFRTKDAFVGKGTWSKGFWVAQHETQEAADIVRLSLNERLKAGEEA